MGILKSIEQKEKEREERSISPKGVEGAVEGARYAKTILCVAEADRRERLWGRVKGIARVGILGTLLLKAGCEVTSAILEAVDPHVSQDLSGVAERLGSFGGKWLVGSVVGLYLGSKSAHAMQECAHEDGMNRRDSLINNYIDGASDPTRRAEAIGALGALNDLHTAMSIMSPLLQSEKRTDSAFDNYLHNIHPSIERNPTKS